MKKQVSAKDIIEHVECIRCYFERRGWERLGSYRLKNKNKNYINLGHRPNGKKHSPENLVVRIDNFWSSIAWKQWRKATIETTAAEIEKFCLENNI